MMVMMIEIVLNIIVDAEKIKGYLIKWIIPSKMEVSTARMSYDFKMSSDYNHGVLKL